MSPCTKNSKLCLFMLQAVKFCIIGICYLTSVMSKYYKVLKNLPRIGLENIKENPYQFHRRRINLRRKKRGVKFPTPDCKPPIGSYGEAAFHKEIPTYGFNRASHLKRQYLPFSLWQLQNMIDLGRIDPSQPIDINTIVNARCLPTHDTEPTVYGVYLVEQGANIFEAKVNIEIQIADRLSVASIERNGGTITTAFYDRPSFVALCDPVKYFLSGHPIRKRLLPPKDLLPYYTDPSTRGYLSDPMLVQKERLKLSIEYGYDLPDISKDSLFKMLIAKKDPRQIFYGLDPGWVVNLADETVIKPQNDYLKEHFFE